MKRSLLLLALVAAVPLSQADAQRGRRSKKDSSSVSVQALGAGAAIGTGLLALFVSDDDAYAGPNASCVGTCAPARRSGSMAFSRAGKPMLVLGHDAMESSPPLRKLGYERGAVETLDDALRANGMGKHPSELAANAYNTNLPVDGSATYARAGGKSTALMLSTELSMVGSANAGCAMGECVPGVAEPVVMSGGDPAFLMRTAAMAAAGPLDPGAAVGVIVNPEPGTIVLTLGGLAGLALVRRRTRAAR